MIKNKDLLQKFLGFNIINLKKTFSVIALILGAIAYGIISKIVDKILMTFLPLKKMNSLDEFWLYDDKDSLSNVSCLFSLHKTKFEVIQKFFYHEFCTKLPKTRCKLVKIFGKYYWKEMGQEEFDKKFPEIIIKVTGIHDKESLNKFMLEKINTELDLYDNVAFKFWVIEDYSENESLLFGIQNHAFIDGLNFVASMKLLSLDNDMKKVEQVKGMSLWNQLLGKMLLPFITLKVILRFLMLPFANNCIKRPPPEVRNKWLAISENFDRDEF